MDNSQSAKQPPVAPDEKVAAAISFLYGEAGALTVDLWMAIETLLASHAALAEQLKRYHDVVRFLETSLHDTRVEAMLFCEKAGDDISELENDLRLAAGVIKQSIAARKQLLEEKAALDQPGSCPNGCAGKFWVSAKSVPNPDCTEDTYFPPIQFPAFCERCEAATTAARDAEVKAWNDALSLYGHAQGERIRKAMVHRNIPIWDSAATDK